MHIRLEAHAPASTEHCKGVARYYEIHVQRDLLGHHLVELSWGRCGAARGQRKLLALPTEAEALAVANRALRRRKGSARRCGAAYVPVAVPQRPMPT